MNKIILLLFFIVNIANDGQKLPDGITTSSSPCSNAKGLNVHYFNKDNSMVAMIEPSGCNYTPDEGIREKHEFMAEFYPANSRKNFATDEEAIKWLTTEMEEYYKPVVVHKWLKLDNSEPKISLNYPEGWSYRTAKDDITFKYKASAANKLVIMVNNSELLLIIRTPNTGNQSIKQVMDITAMWNRAIDFNKSPVKDISIGGRTFKTTENTFAMMMFQKHYWYADDKEIIYIVSGLLKDDRVRYPIVVSDIIKSINW